MGILVSRWEYIKIAVQALGIGIALTTLLVIVFLLFE